uniref:Putative conserved secreted protein n=1 Tax=Culex tarsalis TaxID=7177 RepID=A0A1Q3F8T5_CULTA
MIIFLYLILVLAWALLIIILKCKKARAKRLAELQEASQPVHVVQIGSNLYDIMSIQHHHHTHPLGRVPPYGTVYDCLGTGDHHHHHATTTTGSNGGAGGRSLTTSVTHSNAAFVGDDGSVYPGSHISPLEPPPSYDEVIRLPAHYPKVETFVPEMVVPPSSSGEAEGAANRTGTAPSAPSNESPPAFSVSGLGRIKPISTTVSSSAAAQST